MIRVSQHVITEEDIIVVGDVLRRRHCARGPWIRKLEEEFAATVGAKYAVAVNSGTTALYLACRAAGIGPGKIVGVPPVTFPATANAVLMCGATVMYVDDGATTDDLDAVTPVHYAGRIMEIEHKCIVHDACHVLGARFVNPQGPRCYSLHPAKQITGGEGGMVVTNDEGQYRELKRLRHNGLEHDGKADPWWPYSWTAVSGGYWMSDINAALAFSQLTRLDQIIAERRKIASVYWKNLPMEAKPYLQRENEYRDSFALFPVLIDFNAIERSRTQVMFDLLKRGIETQVHYKPLHLHPMGGGKRGDLPHAERFYDQELTLPMHNAMTPEDAVTVCDALTEVIHG